MSIRVICVDENPISFHGIHHALVGARIEIGPQLADVASLQEYLKSNLCDVIVSEMRLGDSDIVDAFSDIRKIAPNVKIIIYSYVDNPTYVARAAACDAWDFVLKTQPINRLIEAIRSAMEDERPSNSLLLTARTYLRSKHVVPNPSFGFLTKREQQILIHLSLGLCNREISLSLDISVETAKEHVQNVLRKIKVKDRTAAAVWAIRNGLPAMRIDSGYGVSSGVISAEVVPVHANSA